MGISKNSKNCYKNQKMSDSHETVVRYQCLREDLKRGSAPSMAVMNKTASSVCVHAWWGKRKRPFLILGKLPSPILATLCLVSESPGRQTPLEEWASRGLIPREVGFWRTLHIGHSVALGIRLPTAQRGLCSTWKGPVPGIHCRSLLGGVVDTLPASDTLGFLSLYSRWPCLFSSRPLSSDGAAN